MSNKMIEGMVRTPVTAEDWKDRAKACKELTPAQKAAVERGFEQPTAQSGREAEGFFDALIAAYGKEIDAGAELVIGRDPQTGARRVALDRRPLTSDELDRIKRTAGGDW